MSNPLHTCPKCGGYLDINIQSQMPYDFTVRNVTCPGCRENLFAEFYRQKQMKGESDE